MTRKGGNGAASSCFVCGDRDRPHSYYTDLEGRGLVAHDGCVQGRGYVRWASYDEWGGRPRSAPKSRRPDAWDRRPAE